MKPSRIALYAAIAVAALAIAWHLLANDPAPGWPINLIHLLSRH